MRAIVPIALLVLLVGTAAGADVFKRYAIPGHGISLSIPATWRALDYRQVRSIDEVKRFVRGDPDFYPTVRELARPRSFLKFAAIDPRVHFRTRDGGAIRASVNVVVAPASAGLTFERHRQALVRQLRRVLGRDAAIVDDVVTIGDDRAVRIRSTHRRQLGSVTLTIYDTQYAFLRPRRSIVITYEAVKQIAARYAKVFRQSAETIQVR